MSQRAWDCPRIGIQVSCPKVEQFQDHRVFRIMKKFKSSPKMFRLSSIAYIKEMLQKTIKCTDFMFLFYFYFWEEAPDPYNCPSALCASASALKLLPLTTSNIENYFVPE